MGVRYKVICTRKMRKCENACFVDNSHFCHSEFVLTDFKHKEALVFISYIVNYKTQASAELLKLIMILEDLGFLSIFSREAVTVML